MRNNQKGFAITSFLYAILIVFLVVFTVLLMGLINSQLTLQKIKKDVRNKVEENSLVQNGEYVELVVSPKNIEIEAGEEINLLDGVYLVSYDNTKIDTTITYTSNPEFSNDVAGTYLITYTATYNGVLYSGIRNIIVNKEILSPPEFTYTGEYEFIDEGEGSWRIKFKTSGRLTFTNLGSAQNGIDIFLVGGGGGGGSYNGSGGGGGYTRTVKHITMADPSYYITIGQGGSGGTSKHAGGDGEATTFDTFNAAGGKGGKSGSSGGAGGSGGGSCANTQNGTGVAAAGGSDGANGGASTYTGGAGQGTTTREFAESSGVLYAGGGGGSSEANGTPGEGGAGGGGKGGKGYANGESATANTGGGGGGAMEDGYTGGKGASGIVVIRNAR